MSGCFVVKYIGIIAVFSQPFSIANHVELRPENSSQCQQQDINIVNNSTQYFITSPGYPNNYATDLNCLYKITSHFTGRIKITFSDFDTVDNSDFLQIFDGNSMSPNSSLGRFSGYKGEFMLFSATNSASFLFTSSHSSSGKKGFAVLVQYSDQSQVGVYTYKGYAFGVVMSPRYPSAYRYYDWEIYYITVRDNSKNVALTITLFETELYNDYLRVYQGLDPSETPKYMFSGTLPNLPRTLCIPGPNMSLKFITARPIKEFRGFFATYSESNCSSEINIPGSNIYSHQPNECVFNFADTFWIVSGMLGVLASASLIMILWRMKTNSENKIKGVQDTVKVI